MFSEEGHWFGNQLLPWFSSLRYYLKRNPVGTSGEQAGGTDGQGRNGSNVRVAALTPPIAGCRMLTFSNNVEPANGFLVRYLRRKLVESDSDINANKEELLRVLDWVPKLWYHLHTFLEKHSTSDFLIGTGLQLPLGVGRWLPFPALPPSGMFPFLSGIFSM